MKSPKKTFALDTAIWAAIIGAVAVVIAAIISGVFLLHSVAPSPTTNTPTPTHSQGPTATSTHTSSVPSPTPSPTSTNYTAAQPGPSCDTGGGMWAVQGLNQIQCGTTISSNTDSRGYLYLQLPNNATFSSTNKINIMGGNLNYVTGPVCLGLAEQGTNTGVLGEYCGNGGWFIYSISSTGVITQTLNKGLTSERCYNETPNNNNTISITNFSYISQAS